MNQPSPALAAAQLADAKVAECLKERRSFLLEAGAGAGKTHSLVEALKSLIETEGANLRRRNQRIACITYTNAATAIVSRRIDGNRLVFVDTIHAFCWLLVKPYQPQLRSLIQAVPSWQTKIEANGPIETQHVEYDLGYRKITPDKITVNHDDVLEFFAHLLELPKFRAVVADQFPVILIDEYQDTDQRVMQSLSDHFVGREGGPLIGLFGDHWQQIYERTCGHVENDLLAEIGKGANFRSSTRIVSVLNNMRPNLPQAVKDETFIGSARAFHTNGWVGTRRTGAGGGHWTGDLPTGDAHVFLRSMLGKLRADGWDLADNKTKILMLTHNVLAEEQGYRNLANAFDYNEQYIKKEDPYIAFFADALEPACVAYAERRYGQMLELLGAASPKIASLADKSKWAKSMEGLIEVRNLGAVGDVLSYIKEREFPRLPDPVQKLEDDFHAWQPPSDGSEVPSWISRIEHLKGVPYSEVMALDRFIDGNTPFATKHSVKGDEFENVLVVFGRGWNRYNFDQFLEWERSGIPANRIEAHQRNRNLFYVCCSRPRANLALLFTQELSSAAISTLESWFGQQAVIAYSQTE